MVACYHEPQGPRLLRMSTSIRRRRFARYSLDKFKAFLSYNTSTSMQRVIVCTPLLPLLGALAPVAIPLQDPRLGFSVHAPSFHMHVLVVTFLTVIGGSFQYREIAQISADDYSTRIVAASAIATAVVVGICSLLSSQWHFPVPFYWVLIYAPWMCTFVLTHVTVSGASTVRHKHMRKRVLGFLPSRCPK